MKRGKVKALSEAVWLKPLDDDEDFEVAIVPSEALNIDTMNPNVDPVLEMQRVCRRVFVDFRGYQEDDGKDVRNTLEARTELWRWSPVRDAIKNRLFELSQQALEGEGDAASD